jgi:hypothetical protein
MLRFHQSQALTAVFSFRESVKFLSQKGATQLRKLVWILATFLAFNGSYFYSLNLTPLK